MPTCPSAITDVPPNTNESVHRPRVLAIASGKGGVGKSSVAVNLGITLARQGRRVCILDADTGLANVNILLGLRPRMGLADVLGEKCAIEDILVEGPHGLRIIPGASGFREFVELSPTRQRRLVTELARVERQFDDLILDTAAGISDTTLDFLAAADQVLLLITPEPTSLTDAFSLLKLLLRRHAVDCQVIVNMVVGIDEARSVFHRFSGAVERYLKGTVNFLGFIQRDESLRSAVTLQSPVALFGEDDPSARPFVRLANALHNGLRAPAAGPSLSRLWTRQLAQPEDEAESRGDTERRPDPPDTLQSGSLDRRNDTTPQDDGLTRLREIFQRVTESGDSYRIAECIQGLEADYRARFGMPAVDPETAVDWLIKHPEISRAALRGIRRRLLEAARGPDELAVAAEQAPPSFGPPHAGMRTASDTDQPAVTPTRPTHRFACERFGSQKTLTETLRRSIEDPRPLTELLRDWV